MYVFQGNIRPHEMYLFTKRDSVILKISTYIIDWQTNEWPFDETMYSLTEIAWNFIILGIYIERRLYLTSIDLLDAYLLAWPDFSYSVSLLMRRSLLAQRWFPAASNYNLNVILLSERFALRVYCLETVPWLEGVLPYDKVSYLRNLCCSKYVYFCL